MISIKPRAIWRWKELAFVCPKGHGEYVTTDPKEIFKVVKTGMFYCPQCQQNYEYGAKHGAPKT